LKNVVFNCKEKRFVPVITPEVRTGGVGALVSKQFSVRQARRGCYDKIKATVPSRTYHEQ
jgi:hypothetical protein